MWGQYAPDGDFQEDEGGNVSGFHRGFIHHFNIT
jgi:hypothetical protein